MVDRINESKQPWASSYDWPEPWQPPRAEANKYFIFTMPPGIDYKDLSEAQKKLLRDIVNNNLRLINDPATPPEQRKEEAVRAVDQLIINFHFEAALFINQLPPEVLRLFYATVIDRIKKAMVETIDDYVPELSKLGPYSRDELLIVGISTMYAEDPRPKEGSMTDATGRGIMQVSPGHRTSYATWSGRPEDEIDFLDGLTCIEAWAWLTFHTTLPSLFPEKYGVLVTPTEQQYQSSLSKKLLGKLKKAEELKTLVVSTLFNEYNTWHGQDFSTDYQGRSAQLLGGGHRPSFSELTDQDVNQAVLVSVRRNYDNEWIPVELFHNNGNKGYKWLIRGYDPFDRKKMNLKAQTYNGVKFDELEVAKLPVRFHVHYQVLSNNHWILEDYYQAAQSPISQSDEENYQQLIANPDLGTEPVAPPPAIRLPQLQTPAAPDKDVPILEPAPEDSLDLPLTEPDTFFDQAQKEIGQVWARLTSAWNNFWGGSTQESGQAEKTAAAETKEKETFLAGFSQLPSTEARSQAIEDIAWIIKVYNPLESKTKLNSKDNPTDLEYTTAVKNFTWLIEKYASDYTERAVTNDLVLMSRQMIEGDEKKHQKRHWTVRGQGVVFLGTITEQVQSAPSWPAGVNKTLFDKTRTLFKKIKTQPSKYCPTDEVNLTKAELQKPPRERTSRQDAFYLAATFLEKWAKP